MTETNHAIENAKGWWHSICEMLAAVEDADCGQDQDASDAARQRIEESVLSVEVRSGWYSPYHSNSDKAPEEYRILLTAGGPALQISGDVDEHMQVVNAELEWQDWGTPWTRAFPDIAKSEGVDWSDFEDTLKKFASYFIFDM